VQKYFAKKSGFVANRRDWHHRPKLCFIYQQELRIIFNLQNVSRRWGEEKKTLTLTGAAFCQQFIPTLKGP